MKWNYEIISRYRSRLIVRWMRFCAGGSCHRTCAIDLHSGATGCNGIERERLHDGTVAPVRIDGLGASFRVCTYKYTREPRTRAALTHPRTHANSCRPRSLKDVSVLSACRSLLPHPSRTGVSAFRRHIHNGRLFMVSVSVSTVVLICATSLTDDQFSLAPSK